MNDAIPESEEEYRRVIAQIRKRRESASYAQHSAMPLELVQRYGALGYTLLHRVFVDEPAERYYDLHNAPLDSPWRRAKPASAAEIVADVFAPLAPVIPTFVDTLRRLCRAVVVGHRPERDREHRRRAGWHLVYLLDRGEGHEVRHAEWLGGAPMARPRLSRAVRDAGWVLPASLAQLYAVHNGLGSNAGLEFGTACVESAKQLRLVRKSGGRMLEFYCDDDGNRRCFRAKARVADPPVVEWDASAWERARGGTLWEFIETTLRADLLGTGGADA